MFSEPVIGEKFFGRSEVLELLNKRVSALKDGYRQNIALTGPSLAGKSSIILHFLHTVRDEGFVPVYVEIVREQFKSFADKFIATLLYNSLSRLGESLDPEINLLIERAQKAMPKTSLAIKQIYSHIDREEFDEAYLDLLGLTSILKAETNLSCVVILDEFDKLENLGVKNPFLGFGKVIMVQKDTMYIVSSSRSEAIKKILSEKLSLLFGNFEVVRIANFDLKTASDFLDIKFAGFETERGLKEFLIAFTGGNPFYLDKIAYRAWQISSEKLSTFIDCDCAGEAILDLVYNANGILHQYLVNFIFSILDTKHRDNHMAILIAIAGGANKLQEIARSLKSQRGEISKSLAGLLAAGVISKTGVFYAIDDAMLRFWLKNVYQRRKSLLVDGTFDKMKLFTKDMRSYISSFVEESGKPAVSRLAELFNSFSDELVLIDSKQMKLPHFTKVEVKSFQSLKPVIAASFRGNFWMIQPHESDINENDVINYIKAVKSSECKVSNKIIIALKGIDENAKLLAKELKISIWDCPTVNKLLDFYGKKRIIIL